MRILRCIYFLFLLLCTAPQAAWSFNFKIKAVCMSITDQNDPHMTRCESAIQSDFYDNNEVDRPMRLSHAYFSLPVNLFENTLFSMK